MSCFVCTRSPTKLGMCRLCWELVPKATRAHIAQLETTVGEDHHSTRFAVRMAMRMVRRELGYSATPKQHSSTPRETELL